MKKVAILLSLIVTAYGGNVLNVPATYTTIQAGIDAASNGDTVLVAAGTYKENINFNGKNIVVGSLYMTTNDTSYISSTIIDGNEAGSVVTINGSYSKLSGFTVTNGYSSSFGGGIHMTNGATVMHCIISNNYASFGGGIYCWGTNTLTRTDSSVINSVRVINNSGSYGGIVFLGGAPNLENSIIMNNSGNGLWTYSNSGDDKTRPYVQNVLIANNSARGVELNRADPFFSAVTIVNNGSDGIFCYNNSDPTAINSIIWGNSINISDTYSSANITYSNIQGGYSGTGNIDSDPQFVKVITTGDEESDYHLADWSPAIGAGTATGAPTTDIEGNPRPNPAGSNPDMGAYENSLASPLPKVIKVPTGYATIQAAIDASSNGDTVSVSAGTYKENINFNGKNIVVLGEDKETTIIDGSSKSESVVIVNFGKISGFTISNGAAWHGGGIWSKSSGSGVELTNLIISNNAADMGGGIYLASTNPVVKNVVVKKNNSGQGAGILLSNTSATFTNVIISDNTGDGIYYTGNLSGSSSSFTNVTITNNSGRGLWFGDNSNPTITNSVIYGNNNDDIFKNSGINQGELTITYSITKTLYTGTGNINEDPKFVKIVTTGDEESDYHLKDSSPAIGAGTATGAPTTDIEGNPRPNPAGSNPDMGAFENKWGTPQNAPPVLTALSDVSVNEDESYSDTLRATDEEGDAITYSASSDTSAVTASITDSILTLTPNANWHGVANIKAYASDGTSKDSTSFKLTVTAVNDAPVISAIPDDSTNEETEKAIVVRASDVEGDALTYTATSDTSAVGLTISSDTLKLTPATNYTGTAKITVVVSDNALKDTTSFNFKVININDSPVISTLSDVTINEDETGTATLSAADVENDAITYSAVSDTNAVTASVTSSTLTLTPNANWNGSSVITVYASDGKDMDSTKFNLTVDPMQDTPYNFDWVSTASDSINITQSNLTDTYDLKWNTSNEVDGETIDYLISASVGQLPAEMINETADTSMTIAYQDIIDNWYPNLAMLSRATIKFSVSATDGIDTVNVTGDDRVLFVNRYEYLSTEGEGIPTEFALHENYPNPFNPTTTLRFDLPEVSNITLTIYNMLGQKVKTFNMQSTPAGYHSINWNATNDFGEQVGAGVYLYQLQTKDFVKTRKMVLLK